MSTTTILNVARTCRSMVALCVCVCVGCVYVCVCVCVCGGGVGCASILHMSVKLAERLVDFACGDYSCVNVVDFV